MKLCIIKLQVNKFIKNSKLRIFTIFNLC